MVNVTNMSLQKGWVRILLIAVASIAALFLTVKIATVSALPVPIAAITNPLADESTKIDTNTSLAAAGTATTYSFAQVDRVAIALKNIDTQEWLQTSAGSGTWLGGEGTRVAFDATLSTAPPNTSTQKRSWTWSSPTLPNGYYQLEAQVFDSNSDRSEVVKVRFYVDNPGPGDTQRPTGGVISTPLHSTSTTHTVAAGTQLIAEGIARDTTNDPLTNAEVKQVFISVKVRGVTPAQWLQNDTGTPTFGLTRKVFTATLGTAYAEDGAVKRPWIWTAPVMPAGTYSIEAQASDSSDYREGSGTAGVYLCRTGETCQAYPYAWFNVTTGTTGDTAPPAQGVITSPLAGSSHPVTTSLTMTGTAKDTSNDIAVVPSIQKVMIAIKDLGTNTWLQDPITQTWGATRKAFASTLVDTPVTENGVLSQDWNWTIGAGLPAGSYRMEAQPFDNYTNKQTPPQKVDFTVGQLDTVAPASGVITSPLDYGTWHATTAQSFSGVARDTSNGDNANTAATNISQVKITVRDNDTGLYRQTDGTFAAQRVVFDATLGAFSYDATSQTWSQPWTWTPSPALPVSSEYIVSAKAVDLEGNVEDTTPITHVAIGASTGSAYLTIDFGRAQWQQYADSTCTTPVSSSTGTLMTLDQVASAMHSRTVPVPAVGNVTPNRTVDTGSRTCISGISYPSWTDLSNLRNQKAWKFISTGQAYTELDTTTFPYLDPDSGTTVATLDDEICGSINAFTARGHMSSHGMFAYPNNKFPVGGSENPAKTCFDFGRTYKMGYNIKSKAADPWWAKTNSINGGLCNDESLACYTASGVPGATSNTKRYIEPALVGRLMSPRIGTWSIVQFYRFVQGSKTSGAGPNWDCTSSNWREHWTSQTELYCWTDFESALNTTPSFVQIKDPATVGNNWRP